jgi:HMG (high mobility group) box
MDLKKSSTRPDVKKPLTAYMRFHQQVRPTYDKTTMSFKDITKAVVARWKAMSDDEKAPFVEQYKQEAEQYKALKKVTV